MSFRTLVIPEDPKLNGHILRPLVEALLEDAGKPKARVKVLDNPRLRGYDQAVQAIRGDQLHASYAFYDLWLFFPDADLATPDAMMRLEADLQARGVPLLCCPAQPEVEVYACVAFRSDPPGTWDDARNHPRMKEEVFRPLLTKHGTRVDRGEGET